MEKPTQTLMRSAVDMVGGEEELATALHVPREELHAWIDGSAEPPPGALMEAADLVSIKAQLRDCPPEE